MEGAMSVGDQFFVVVDPSRKEKNLIDYFVVGPSLAGLCEIGLDSKGISGKK